VKVFLKLRANVETEDAEVSGFRKGNEVTEVEENCIIRRSIV
jgi:hypothetical protein